MDVLVCPRGALVCVLWGAGRRGGLGDISSVFPLITGKKLAGDCQQCSEI